MLYSGHPIHAKKYLIAHLQRVVAILIAVCFAFQGTAQTEAELIERRVLEAERTFLKSVEREQKALRSELTSALNRAIDKAAGSGDLNSLELLQKQLEALIKDGTLPKGLVVRPSISRFHQKTKRIGDALIERYQRALRSYAQARQIDEARLIEEKIRWIRPTRGADLIAFQDHHYLVVRESVTWLEAEQACNKRGGYLACINSKDELAFVHKHAKKINTWIWLGATDRENEGDWVWLDGSDQFWQWDHTEPNSLKGEDEDYAALFTTGRMFDWISIRSEKVGGYICEWEHLPTRLTVYTPEDEQAEDEDGAADK